MPGLFFQIEKLRFIEEVKKWTQSDDRFVNYSEDKKNYYFYLVTPDCDFCCIVNKKDDLIDIKNLLEKGKKIIKRMKDNNMEIIKETISDEIKNIRPDVIDTVEQSMRLAEAQKNSEKILQELVNKNA